MTRRSSDPNPPGRAASAARLGPLLAVAAAPVLVLAVVVLFAPWSSWSARGYALAIVAMSAALHPRVPARAAWLGAALFAAVLAARLAGAAHGRALTMTRAGGASRWSARLVDERDASVWGARLVFAAGWFPDPDAPAVVPALLRGYDELAAREGSVPSPVLPTYLGLERRGASDVLAYDDLGAARPRGALVFLHGFGGGFTLPCWQLAVAVAPVGFVTRCPSLDPRARWWSDEGEAIVRETLASLRAEGSGRVVLAGLSNGAVGVARLAPKLAGSIDGVVLVSGAAPAASPGVPALVLQGERDATMPPSIARAYADAHGATYVALRGGHFALLLERERATSAIAAWLARLARDDTAGRAVTRGARGASIPVETPWVALVQVDDTALKAWKRRAPR